MTPTPTVDDARPAIALFFPVYNDGHAIDSLAEKAVRILSDIASSYEILIINDGSTDDTGRAADELARRFDRIRVIHHPHNRGYGAAIRTGVQNVGPCDWVCFTDGDHQYDISEIRHFLKVAPRYDMLIGFRAQKTYGPWRKFVSAVFNFIVRRTFGTPFRDVTCGFKLVRRPVLDGMNVLSRNAFAGGEIAVRAYLAGHHVGEAAISMYPREVGRSSILSIASILTTWSDIRAVHRDIFRNRPRGS